MGSERVETAAVADRPGTYAVVLHLVSSETIWIGRLGPTRFPFGRYLYIGSALGPGGLAARVRHHLLGTHRPHWHIDYLRNRATVESVWIYPSRSQWEHRWAAALQRASDAFIPVTGFGCSDCRCSSHLFLMRPGPDPSAFGKAIRRAGARGKVLRFAENCCLRRLAIDKCTGLG